MISNAPKVPELSRHAAEEFATKWKNTKEEKQFAESFWNDFFRNLCGVEDPQVAGIEFQKPVKNSVSGNTNYLMVTLIEVNHISVIGETIIFGMYTPKLN